MFKKWKHTISSWVCRELYKWEVTQTDWGDMEGAHPAVLQFLEGLHAPATPPGVFSTEACVVNISLLNILFIFSWIYADKHDRRRSVPDSSDWHEDAIIFHVSVGNCNESWLIISLELFKRLNRLFSQSLCRLKCNCPLPYISSCAFKMILSAAGAPRWASFNATQSQKRPNLKLKHKYQLLIWTNRTADITFGPFGESTGDFSVSSVRQVSMTAFTNGYTRGRSTDTFLKTWNPVGWISWISLLDFTLNTSCQPWSVSHLVMSSVIHTRRDSFKSSEDMNNSSFCLEAIGSLISCAVISAFSWASEDKWPH